MRTTRRIAPAGMGAALLLSVGMGAASAAVGDANANLTLVALDGVAASGTAMARVEGTTLTVTMAAEGLLPDAPHAAHIHVGATARNECPAASDDASGDGTLDTSEGGPAYGDVVVSLTTTGDTSPASALAVDRFDTAPGGKIAYQRGSITVEPDAFPTSRVYGNTTDRAELRLITCGGAFDRGTGHYVDNVVAFAHLVT